MFIASTINSKTKSNDDLPIMVVCFNDTRKFISRPDSYEELASITRNKFGLRENANPIFATSTLDICKGKPIQIDAETYPFLTQVLDEVTVIEGQTGTTFSSATSTPTSDVFTRLNNLRIDEKECIPDSAVPLSRRLGPQTAQIATRKKSDGPSLRATLNSAMTATERSEHRLGQHSKELREIEEEQYALSLQELEDRVFNAFENSNGSLPSASSRSTQSSQSSLNPDAHFVVRIRAPESQEAEFKTRGKHTIKKVLLGACNTFDLDYERARLILVLSEPEGGHDMYYCEPEESMASCGIMPDSTLVIHVEPESDDDDHNRYDDIDP